MNKKIVLASSSPRRQQILKNLDLNFDIIKSNIEEKIRYEESPEHIVMALALEKAIDISNRLNDRSIIIAADTIVYKDEVLGKPKSFDDAFNMLSRLQDNAHLVYTGLAVIQGNTYKKIVTYEKTIVKIKKLSEDKIRRYIETGEVWDKAGSYAIQGSGSTIVEWVKGDYFNVVGLPISKLDDILSNYFDINLI
ncbi:Maf family protein [Paramaledivibacter caminithermalis]|jgi:septum formation protein|uniref:dTTP/UTP pyrophosphatase n=1 Tax=Paramaledivibacter caminithermalis (strain DSM 15212 / CIP 107654 / DViRD3) TaxID=1121301 RepID=A0A1M6MF68_PARC5|nr:Maf family protein [Paramaledivibacter caminithermalis]SHJ82068.1 septum formation protein [Paramaledivibacter caminithermalis DSM 15212]